MHGLRSAARIPELFAGLNLSSSLLGKIVRTQDEGGCFPAGLSEQLDWFFDNFDCEKAAKGEFEPSRGVSTDFDDGCDAITELEQQLEQYKEEISIE